MFYGFKIASAKSFILLVLTMTLGWNLHAKDYNASFFGIKSDGITDNTRSIQKAIDYIQANRGGTLVFYVGRYVTGTIQLKSRVNIRLEEGAVIVGSSSPFDYTGSVGPKALLEGSGVSDFKIYGKGVIEGGGSQLVRNADELQEKGYIDGKIQPGLISFSNGRNIAIDGIHLWNGPYHALSFSDCKNIMLENLDVNGNDLPASEGIRLQDCKWITLKNLFVEVEGSPLITGSNQYLTLDHAITADGQTLVQEVNDSHMAESASSKSARVGTRKNQDYDVLSFGARNDGITLNTNIIQAAIDFISEHGGGRLIFPPGRYVSGSIYLKSGVTMHLEESAELLGSTNPWDFVKDEHIGWTSFIFGYQSRNIGITGKGVVNANGFVVANHLVSFIHSGIVNDALSYDRPDATNRPTNIYFRECGAVEIRDVTQKNPASWNLVLDQCRDVRIDGIHIDSRAYWNNDGIDIVDCDGLVMTNSYIDASDDALCFKSHDPNSICQNIVIDSCTLKSSASGLKFGTVNRGGFKNIKITNLEILDTYRSAITLQAVDGGIVEDIVIDGVEAKNVGNALFIRMGDRWNNGDVPSIRRVAIKNVYAEIAESKADAGYRYEGPVEDLPRNISPCSIVGLPDWRVQDVVLSDFEVVYPGGANPHYAYRGMTKEALDSIPEMAYRYPEFSQFKELPAWGFYVRHADRITFDKVRLSTREKDYRPAFVLDDAQGINFTNVDVNGADVEEDADIISHNAMVNVK